MLPVGQRRQILKMKFGLSEGNDILIFSGDVNQNTCNIK